MKLLTIDIEGRLLRNGRIRNELAEADDEHREPDFPPVVKLFTPDANCTWLLSELDPDEPDIVFGLCDMGMGFPELGSVSLSEIASVRGPMGLPVERDRYFTAQHALSVYARAARIVGGITEDAQALAQAAAAAETEDAS